MRGKIYNAVSGKYTVKTEEGFFDCSVRKKLKNGVDLFVGDDVEIDEKEKTVETMYPRRNVLIRPYVSNLDLLLIVVAPVPKPDWLLVEKLLLNCYAQKITPVIVLNKCDLIDEKGAEEYFAPYKEQCLAVSALENKNVDALKELIRHKTVCFAGQSAVGKTSLLNALSGQTKVTGDLSRKIKRGKNTTRTVDIYDVGDASVIDTCGFSILETVDVKYDELVFFYDDYVKNMSKCRYDNCTHTTEPDCEVKRLVEEGKLSKVRYERYVTLYNEMKEKWRKKYE